MDIPPTWLQAFLDRLTVDGLSIATHRGYCYDLRQFIAWYTTMIVFALSEPVEA